MKPTQIPQAIEAIVAALRARPALAGVLILDGPVLSGQYRLDNIVIGWSEDDYPAATVQRSAPLGLRPNDSESFTIGVYIACANGAVDGTGVRQARDRAGDLLSELHEMLTSDITLGDVVSKAVLGPNEMWWQASGASETGASVQECTIRTEISCYVLL